MAEYIDRQELLENLNKFAPEHYSALVNTLITKQPTADVVEVVRCKDCLHNVANWQHSELDETDYSDITCDYFMTDGMCSNDFCSYGERK